MLPDKRNEKWKSLINGGIKHEFKVMAAGLMVSRLQRDINKNNSTENYQKCIDEAYNYFSKYEKLFESDIKSIFG